MQGRADTLAVIRGELEWHVLQGGDTEIDFGGAALTVEERSVGVDAVRPEITDIACGFIAHRSDRKRMKEWAGIVLALNRIDLGALEDHAEGELVLEGLWDASHGEELSVDFFQAIARLTK